MSLPERVAALGDGLAIVDGTGAHDRASLARRAAAVRQALQTAGLGPNGEIGARVAVLGRPGADWCAALFGAWSAGAIVVPLHHRHPADELAYRLDDAQVSIVLATDELGSMAHALAARCAAGVVTLPGSAETVGADGLGAGGVVPVTAEALIVHTSGTTGRPKGVVHTHRSLAAQAAAMVEAWEWSADDRTLCVLPLDHVHGIVNATLTPLSVGAVVEMADGFEAEAVWERFASGELTVFTAVPTVYARLVRAWEQADAPTRRRWSDGASGLRLMISGSAALPVPVLERWREVSGHVLLERYGMTELGMVLGNTLDRRVPGHVGWPFPRVEVRADASSGELLVRGPQVFDRYWNRPEATAAAFDGEWFRTGDVAVDDGVEGWRLLGRASVDILKSGGEKVSALEIEATYRTHPAVDDCAVVGLPDDEWGQRVAMAWIAAQPGVAAEVDGAELRAWGKERLAAAKVPVEFLRVDDLPRNALGKVTKPAVVDLFGIDGGSPAR
jgi:malonyl-CoA/methylmalonyl-CoA synthetase